jgi:hypothetical protein
MPELVARTLALIARRRVVVRATILATLGVVAACGGGTDGDGGPVQGTDFVFQSRALPDAERFVVRIADTQVRKMARAELLLPMNQRRLFPNGRLFAGNGGHNSGWSWHLRDVQLVAVTIELCDGRASMVEANLEDWLQRVQRFCPWSARVVAELGSQAATSIDARCRGSWLRFVDQGAGRNGAARDSLPKGLNMSQLNACLPPVGAI